MNILYQVITVLNLFSALVLADALRKIRAAVKQNPLLETNSKIMCLHVLTLVCHSMVLSITAFFVFRSFEHPNNVTFQYERGYSRLALFASQTLVQSFIVYLYINFYRQQYLSSSPSQDENDTDETILATGGGDSGRMLSDISPRSAVTANSADVASQSNKRLKLIMYVKNTMEAAGQDSNLLLMQDQLLNNYDADANTNLVFDLSYKKQNKKLKKKHKKAQIRTDSFSTVRSSDDSDLSDDTFLQKVNNEWGEQEGELRQAIFFQFIKSTSKTHDFGGAAPGVEDKIGYFEKLAERHSLMSEENNNIYGS